MHKNHETKTKSGLVALSFFAPVIAFALGAAAATYATRDALHFAQSERDACINQIASYRADTKAEVHSQLQMLSKKYMVLKEDVFIDIINAASVDLEKEYANLYSGEFPVR